MFDEFLRLWALEADGSPVYTPGSALLPVVTRDGRPAMLKVSTRQSEMLSAPLLEWWDGRGAVRVLASQGPATLLERAEEPGRLLRMYEEGLDEEAVNVIAGVAAKLHTPRAAPAPAAVAPLAAWFVDLQPAAERLGGVLHSCARAATTLLARQAEVVVLHGDLHHENVLHFGARGWLAIDPKGALGERTFDYVPALLDPDDAGPFELARLERQLSLTASAGRLEPSRLRQWLLAWAGLTAAWWVEDGKSPERSLRVAEALAATGAA